MNLKVIVLPLILLFASLTGCDREKKSQEQMVQIIEKLKMRRGSPQDLFDSEAKLRYVDSMLALPNIPTSTLNQGRLLRANTLIELGRENESVSILENLAKETSDPQIILKSLALAYLIQGERANCIANHAAESCILPIRGVGIHTDRVGSTKAIATLEKILAKEPKDLESQWLLNLAYLTIGGYPDRVPAPYFIPGLKGDTTLSVQPFEDIAGSLGLGVSNLSGGCVVDDFDNDGYLDVMTAGWGLDDPMLLYRNNADGTFKDISGTLGLDGIPGGLNMIQSDYNNDGFIDVLVLRGAWRGQFFTVPNSLLRNNGDGTFADVTAQSGILSYHPTQTATWNDFNNDGWVDLFIGNESPTSGAIESLHPCELYINNQDGTFRQVASKANAIVLNFVKGVTSGDFDNDGWQDLYISTFDGPKKLLRNKGVGKDEIPVFEDVTARAGLDKERGKTFPTWFWDYNNDGWLDIFVCDYTFDRSLAHYAAAEKLNLESGNQDKMLLYRNNHDGTFTNVAREMGLDKHVFAMGANFGDIDNDGFLDMYLGTGNPMYQSLIPNVMLKNIGGEKFVDVTTSSRLGHLQKGHGIAFADVDNDGDQDIYAEIGGAYKGDAYPNSLFMNPGQNNNNWICLKLEGVNSNRSAIGTRIKITFTENGVQRSVYRDVNSGGSFGGSPFRREIGIGSAHMIDTIEITWSGSQKKQVFNNVNPNQFLALKEGGELTPVSLKTISWILPDRLCLPEPGSISLLK